MSRISNLVKGQDFDVVIIGAGLAGGLMAWKLAGIGASVLMLEAGQHNPRRLDLLRNYALASAKTPHSPYLNAENDLFAPSPDSPNDYYVQGENPQQQFKSTYERRTGGSTWHWLGHTPRLLPNDFRSQSEYGVGVDWPISYEELEPWYCEAEAALGVAGADDEWQGLFRAYRSQPFPMSQIWPSYSDLKVAQAIDGQSFDGIKFQVVSTPSARNSQLYDGRPPCAGNSICVPLCPIGAKYDAAVHVAKALAVGASLWERNVVTALSKDDQGEVHHVTCQPWRGPAQTVTAGIIVIAAHSIETAKLLLLSGLANGSDQVGRNLMDHLQRAAYGLAREPLFPYRGPPSTSGIEVFRDGDFRKERSAFRISLGNDGWSRKNSPYVDIFNLVTQKKIFGAELQQQLATRISHQLRLSCSAETLPGAENRISLSSSLKDGLGLPRPQISFMPDDYTSVGLNKATAAMKHILELMKATEMDLGDGSYTGAGHIMGTCRMGDNPQTSVVNADCCTHEHPNLYVVGSSTFPTVGTANPSLTVAALALRAAATLQKKLQGASA